MVVTSSGRRGWIAGSWVAAGIALAASAFGIGEGSVQGDDGRESRTSAVRSLPDDRLGTRIAPLLLLSRADVQRDLELTPAQIESARRAIAELQGRAAALRGKTGESVLAARRAIDEAQIRWLERELPPSRRARLDQIDLQWQGPSAIVARPAIAEEIGLRPEQREAISRAVAVRDRRRAQGQGIVASEENLAREVLQILDEDQRVRWRSLMGPPFRPTFADRADSADRSTR